LFLLGDLPTGWYYGWDKETDKICMLGYMDDLDTVLSGITGKLDNLRLVPIMLTFYFNEK
jgi:hypothetical protein